MVITMAPKPEFAPNPAFGPKPEFAPKPQGGKGCPCPVCPPKFSPEEEE